MAAPLSIIFRKAAQRDVDQIVKIYLDCFSKWESNPERIPGFISNRVDNPDYNLVVAEDSPGHVAGFLIANCSYARSHGVMNVDVMAVDQQQRRHGLGRRLMHMGELIALNAGAKAMSLQVVEDNFPAQKLYQSIGFNIYATRKNYYQDAARTNAFEMVKYPLTAGAANDEAGLDHPAVQRPKHRGFSF